MRSACSVAPASIAPASSRCSSAVCAERPAPRPRARPALTIAQRVVEREQDLVAGAARPGRGGTRRIVSRPGPPARARAAASARSIAWRSITQRASITDGGLLRRHRRHDRPALRVQPQQPLRLELHERRPHRRPAHPGLGRDLPLRQQVRPRERPVEDPLLHVLVRPPARARRRVLFPWIPHVSHTNTGVRPRYASRIPGSDPCMHGGEARRWHASLRPLWSSSRA